MERDEKRLSDQRHSLEVTQARKDCEVSAKEALDEILGKNLWYKSFIVCDLQPYSTVSTRAGNAGENGMWNAFTGNNGRLR